MTIAAAPDAKLSLSQLVRWTWQIIRPAPWLIAAAAAADLVVTLGGQVQVQLFARVLDQIRALAAPQAGDAHPSLGLAYLLVAVVILLPIFSFAARAITAFADSRMLEQLQLSLHDKLLRLGVEWHDRHDTATSVQLVDRIARGAQPILTMAAKYPLVQVIGLCTGSGLLSLNLGQSLNTPWGVQAVGFALLLGLPFVSWWLSNRVRASNAAVQAAETQVSSEILNSLSLPGDIQAIGAAPQRSRRMGERLRTAARARFLMSVNTEMPNQLSQALPTLLQALFLVYAVLAVATASKIDSNAIGAIVAVYFLVPMVVNPLISLINFFTGLNAQWPMIRMFGEVLDAKPATVDKPDARDWPATGSQVSFSGVHFSYAPGAAKILDGVDHGFAPGKLTAIVGRSGSGKSTIIRLLTRLREPTGGTIRMGEVPLDDVKLDDLHRNVAIVGQKALFISDSVRSNFKLADPEVSDAAIEEICRKTKFWDVLVKHEKDAGHPLTSPLDLPMSRDGDPFSGGECRIFAVTRALLRRPAVMLLDEPTTGVNALQLEELAEQLREACRGITTIVVEHNCDFILGLADQVCALDAGRFAQVGDPHRLAAEPGVFHDMLEARRRLAAGAAGMKMESFPAPTIGGAPPPRPKPAAGADMMIAAGSPMKRMPT
ncbi:MAG TPA: ABC transporter ATP-binding protein [Stellaceae bacterium]|nr:ABC transporter ATP-binding protein [Stellaceae bacterium]